MSTEVLHALYDDRHDPWQAPVPESNRDQSLLVRIALGIFLAIVGSYIMIGLAAASPLITLITVVGALGAFFVFTH